jgi:hypothetical protein
MPILPIDSLEPFAATLSVMLYPGLTGEDPNKARTFAARWLSEPIKRAQAAGHHVSYETLFQVAVDAGRSLPDIEERWQDATATGDLFKMLCALYHTDRSRTSWNSAIAIAEAAAGRKRGSRTLYWNAKRQFLSVAHLWGAWSIREGQFTSQLQVGYDGYADFQAFLAEAEVLRDFGQYVGPVPANSSPFLPADVWRVPDGWKSPARQAGWPDIGRVPILTNSEQLMAGLRRAGRPRKGA